MTDPPTRRQLQNALDTLTAGGGLLGRADLAVHWGISAGRARTLTLEDDFPAPAGQINSTPYWLPVDVDTWRNARRPGRPRKTS